MFNLGGRTPFRVERAPLAVATAQVRFPLLARLQNLAGVAGFQDGIIEFLPYMEQVQRQQLSIAIGPFGPVSPTSEQTVVWKFSNDDGWILSLDSGSATLSIGAGYTSGEDFIEKWGQVLEVLRHTTGGVLRCDRIALRYANLVDLTPESNPRYRSWLRPEILGLLGANIFASSTSVRGQVTQTHVLAPHIPLPHPMQGLFRFGLLPAGSQVALEVLSGPLILTSAGFLLDTDLFVEGHQPFVVEQLVDQSKILHAQIEAFFIWALTDEGKNHLGVEAI